MACFQYSALLVKKVPYFKQNVMYIGIQDFSFFLKFANWEYLHEVWQQWYPSASFVAICAHMHVQKCSSGNYSYQF